MISYRKELHFNLPTRRGLVNITKDVVSGIEQSYQKVMRKWPQLQGEFASLGTNEKRPGVYASCYINTGEINVSPYFFQDKAALKRSYSNDVSAGWHPAGTDWESIITHELGHAVDGYLTRNLGKVTGIPANPQVRASKYVLDKVMTNLHLVPNDIRTGLSDYAASKPEEFFSEAMAEYLDSKKPRPIAKATGKLVDKWMKEISKHP